VLVGDNLLLRDFGPYGIIYIYERMCCNNLCYGKCVKGICTLWNTIHECVVITVDMIMLLRYFGPCGIIFMNIYLF
jgi:hypothetical protein